MSDARFEGRDLVLSIGRVYCDLVFRGLEALPRLGEERFAHDVSLVPGGGAFITAAHLSSLGLRAALVARIGIDELSDAIMPALHDSGVDLGWLEHAADAGPQLTVVMVQGGERAFLSRRAGPAKPSTLDAALASPGARHLHIAEFATLAENPGLVGAAKRAGLSVSLDPSWDDALIRDPDLVLRCAGTDVFLPNAAEARAIAGCDDLNEAGVRLSRHFPIIVIKDGADGALLFKGDERSMLSAPQDGPVIDTTGAGDAFNAGFLSAWFAGRALNSALAQGIACGTLSVQRVGGTGLWLDRNRVQEFSEMILTEQSPGRV